MTQGIYINNKWFDHTTLMEYALDSNDLTPFETDTIKFYQDWHTSQETFDQFTSGSTGNPQAIKVSRQKMEHSAQVTLSTLKIQQEQNALLCLNPKYIAGKMMMVRAFTGGLNLICIEPSADPFQNLTAQHKIHFTAIVPQQLQSIVDHSDYYQRVLNKNAKILVGGSKLNSQLEQQAAHLLYSIYHTFGMTETVTHIALRKITRTQDNRYYVLKGIEIDFDSRSCLKIKGFVTDNEWLTTNDIVEIPEAGVFIWKGRYDNVINSGGVKISPETIEKSIESIFQEWGMSYNFFISSISDKTLGQKMILLIESKDIQMTSDEILQKLKPLLPQYMSPKQIFLLPKFAYTPTGKIDRNRTKKLIAE